MFLLQVNKKSYREHIIIPETNVSDKGRTCLPVGQKNGEWQSRLFALEY
jgi:hypothetical protein